MICRHPCTGPPPMRSSEPLAVQPSRHQEGRRAPSQEFERSLSRRQLCRSYGVSGSQSERPLPAGRARTALHPSRTFVLSCRMSGNRSFSRRSVGVGPAPLKTATFLSEKRVGFSNVGKTHPRTGTSGLTHLVPGSGPTAFGRGCVKTQARSEVAEQSSLHEKFPSSKWRPRGQQGALFDIGQGVREKVLLPPPRFDTASAKSGHSHPSIAILRADT